MFDFEWAVMTDSCQVIFGGSYYECNDWVERYCQDKSYLDENGDDIELILYKGERVHYQKMK